MKLVSGRQIGIQPVDRRFQPRDLCRDDPQHHVGRREIIAGRGEVGAEIEQVVLDPLPAPPARATGDRGTPIALFASSTSPIAAMRSESLGVRLPSTSPVVPASPVRV